MLSATSCSSSRALLSAASASLGLWMSETTATSPFGAPLGLAQRLLHQLAVVDVGPDRDPPRAAARWREEVAHPALAQPGEARESLVLDLLAGEHALDVRADRVEIVRADHLDDRAPDEALRRRADPIRVAAITQT